MVYNVFFFSTRGQTGHGRCWRQEYPMLRVKSFICSRRRVIPVSIWIILIDNDFRKEMKIEQVNGWSINYFVNLHFFLLIYNYLQVLHQIILIGKEALNFILICMYKHVYDMIFIQLLLIKFKTFPNLFSEKIWNIIWFGLWSFNNISVISWRSVLLMEEIGENRWPVASH